MRAAAPEVHRGWAAGAPQRERWTTTCYAATCARSSGVRRCAPEQARKGGHARQVPGYEKNSLLLLERLTGALSVLRNGSAAGSRWAATLRAYNKGSTSRRDEHRGQCSAGEHRAQYHNHSSLSCLPAAKGRHALIAQYWRCQCRDVRLEALSTGHTHTPGSRTRVSSRLQHAAREHC